MSGAVRFGRLDRTAQFNLCSLLRADTPCSLLAWLTEAISVLDLRDLRRGSSWIHTEVSLYKPIPMIV
jgi:hypothetical protein